MDDPYDAKPGPLQDLLAAFGLLTRWPVPVDHAWAGQRGAKASWAYPLVGAGLGLVAGISAQILGWFGVPPGMAVVAAMAVLAFATGAMHEDGLADTADGLGPSVPQEKRFEIMSDSRIGAFGATALILAFLGRWNGYAFFDGWGLTATLVATGAASRAMIVAALFALPAAKPTGMAASVGQPTPNILLWAVGLALGIGILGTGWSAIPIAAGATIGAIPVLLLANQKLGGQTGDILGAVQICAEIGAIAAACAMLA